MEPAQATFNRLADWITAVKCDHPLRVAIDGIDCAGKTTLADNLVAPIAARGRPVIRASIDGFHNPRAVRYQRGAESPEGYYLDSFNIPRLIDNLLAPLGPGGSRTIRTTVFDHTTDSPVDVPPVSAAPDAILLFDGIFLLRPELRPHWDYIVWVWVKQEVALSRAIERDKAVLGTPEEITHRYQTRYFPAHDVYQRACEPLYECNALLWNNDPVNPSLSSNQKITYLGTG